MPIFVRSYFYRATQSRSHHVLEFLSLLDQVGYPSIIPASGVSGRKITRKEDVLSVVESAEAAFAILNDLPKDEPPLTYDQLQKFSEQYLEKSKNKSQFQGNVQMITFRQLNSFISHYIFF